MNRYCITCGELAVKQNANLYICALRHENWVNPAAGTAVYIIKDGKVLFGVRSSEPGKGKLDVPGGFINVHESAEQCAVREAKEELGIDIVLTDFLGTYTSTYMGRPALNIVFVGSTINQSIVPADDLSGGDPIWMDINSLPGSGEIMDDWMLDANRDVLAWWRKRQS